MHIGFIGLGHMGGPMAANLLKAGHAVTAFDLSTPALDAAKAAGATLAARPSDAVRDAEVVITMLPAAAHVKAVYLGDDGVLAGVKAGVPLVDSSTIDPATAKFIGAAAAEHGNPPADAGVRRRGRRAGWHAHLHGRRGRSAFRNLASRVGGHG